LFRSFVERGFDCHRLHWLVADHDVDGLSRYSMLGWQITHADVLTARGPRRAAGDPAGGRAIEIHFVAIASDAAAAHFESNELALDAGFFLLDERITPVEVALIEFDDPTEAGFERRDRRVDFVAVERHRRFQTQRVARAQSAGLDAEFGACAHHQIPNALGLEGRHVDFEAVLTGIACARDARLRPCDYTIGEPIIFDAREIDGRELLERGLRFRALNRKL